MHDLPNFLLVPELTFSTKMDFEKTANFLKYLATENDIPSFDDVLLIEIPDGVFLKTVSPKWNEVLHNLSDNNSEYGITSVDPRKWNELTTRYRSPLRSMGNEKLARWRVGF
jgi:hypothetical protein